MNSWSKTISKTVSFRDRPLPPAWIPSPDSVQDARPKPMNDVNLWPVEESGFALKKITDAILSAKEIVCVSSFLFSSDALKQALTSAAKRGVRCYLLTMSEEHLARDPEQEDERRQSRIEEHKKTLDMLAGHVLIRTAPGLHTKFVVIDPYSVDRAEAFVSTANLTNEALTQNVELVIHLKKDRAVALFEQFRCGFWQESEHEVLEPQGTDRHCRVEDIGPAGRRKLQPVLSDELPVTIRDIRTLKATIHTLLDWARDEIWFSAYKFDPSYEITKILNDRLKAGVITRIFISSRKATVEAANSLDKAGAEVYSSNSLLHAKSLIVKTGNEVRGLIMTANVESRGLDSGFETGVLLTAPESNILLDIMSAWAKSFEYRFASETPRGQVEGDCLVWNGKELVRAHVGGSARVGLDAIIASDLRAIDATGPASFQDPSNSAIIPHEAIFSWKVNPPTLPQDARIMTKPKMSTEEDLWAGKGVEIPGYKHDIYEAKGKKYIVVSSPEKLEDAAKDAEVHGAILVADGAG